MDRKEGAFWTGFESVPSISWCSETRSMSVK